MRIRRLLPSIRSRKTWPAAAAALLVVALAGPQLWAWYHLRAAEDELARYRPEQARASLASCLGVWSGRPRVHLLASRAARQAGDFEDADRQLRACQRLEGGTSDDIALEWALLQAAAGNVREVDEYLQARVDRDPRLGPLVWEAMAEGYLRLYRTIDAMACLNHWLSARPDDARALELRGMTYVTGKGVLRGSDDFRRALEVDPGRESARARLAQCLLDLGQYDEALPHLEQLARDHPGDPEVLVRVARCQNMLNRKEEARRTLDAVLAAHPDDGLALRTRGQFALSDQPPRPAEAERWLRRAAEVRPNDYQAQWLLLQALQQQDKAGEAAEQLRRAEEVKARVERVGELTSRKLAEQPLDPGLHYEMGVMLTRAGSPDEGAKWLAGALDLDPDYRPAHAALADYYAAKGDAQRAAEHRRRAAPR